MFFFVLVWFYVLIGSNTSKHRGYKTAEIYSNKYGKLTTKTYYKTRRGTSQRIDDLKTSPRLTSVTDGASPLLIANIPQLFETSIKNNLKNPKTHKASNASNNRGYKTEL